MHVIFTVISRNYLAHARTLMRSVAQSEPSARRIVVLTDGDETEFDAEIDAEVWRAERLAPLGQMKLYYNVLELNTAVKPYAFAAIFADPATETVIYLDPDILVLRSLDPVYAALKTAPLALTPHLTSPLVPGAEPDDRSILLSGVYNLGFLGLARSDHTARFVAWWADRCRFDCRVAFAEGLFTDQRWVDLAPGFFDAHVLLRDSGLNAAYWNLSDRPISEGDEGWMAGSRPLLFFHFSGFDPRRPDILSKHQDRHRVPRKSALDRLLRHYAKLLLANDYVRASAVPYGHDVFRDGGPISALMRRRLLDDARTGRWTDASGDTAVAWLTATDPDHIAPDLAPASRLMVAAWRELGASIPGANLHSSVGREVLRAWSESHLRPEPSLRSPEAVSRPSGTTPVEVRAWLAGTTPGEPTRACEMFLRGNRQWAGVGRSLDLDRERLAWCVGPAAMQGWFPVTALGAVDFDRILADDAAVAVRAAELVLARRNLTVSRKAARLYAAFGLAVDGGWPASIAAELARRLGAVGSAEPDAALAVWDSRIDLQQAFDLSRLHDRARFARWLLKVGRQELGLPATVFGDSAALGVLPGAVLSLVARDPKPARLGPAQRLVLVHDLDRLAGFVTQPGDVQVTLAGEPGTDRAPTLPSQAGTIVHLGPPAATASTVMFCLAAGVAYDESVAVWRASEVAAQTTRDSVDHLVARIEIQDDAV